MKKQQWAKATAVVLAASLLLPSVIPADTQAKAKIRLSAKKISLKVGQTKKLKVKGTKKKVVWKSSKKKIASVSKKGVVKALRRGKAKITAKTAGKKLVCMVTVKNSKIKPTVIPATSAPATASPLATASAPRPCSAPLPHPGYRNQMISGHFQT